MHRNPTPHTWIYRNRHFSSKCKRILPLTHECTEIDTPQVNAPESYPSYMNALKSSSRRKKRRNLTPHTWMHQNRNSSGKCTKILTLTHECTEIIIPQVNVPQSYSSHLCVRGKIPVHFLEGWWFRCLHVWGVGFRCIYLGHDDFGAFMCEG